MNPPNRLAFDRVCADLEHGVPLNLSMIGDIFGQEFWILILYSIANTNIQANKLELHIHHQETTLLSEIDLSKTIGEKL